MAHHSNDHTDDTAAERVSELLERSSLGTVGARELRRRTNDRAARDAVIDSLGPNEAEALAQSGDRRAAARRAGDIEQQLRRTTSFASDDLSNFVRNYTIRYIAYEAICSQPESDLRANSSKLAERFVILQRLLVSSLNNDQLIDVIKRLPEKHRNVFIARIIHGLSVGETADFLALTPRSVILTERRVRTVADVTNSPFVDIPNEALFLHIFDFLELLQHCEPDPGRADILQRLRPVHNFLIHGSDLSKEDVDAALTDVLEYLRRLEMTSLGTPEAQRVRQRAKPDVIVEAPPRSTHEGEGPSIGAHYTNSPRCKGASMTERYVDTWTGDYYLECDCCGGLVMASNLARKKGVEQQHRSCASAATDQHHGGEIMGREELARRQRSRRLIPA